MNDQAPDPSSGSNGEGASDPAVGPAGPAAGGDLAPEQIPSEIARAAELALDRKARDVLAMDLRGISSATDWFLLATGNSDIQVKAIADHILDRFREAGLRPNHVEGLQGGRWVLLDFVDYVVHVFHPTAREFYQLERLWGDAPTLAWPDADAPPTP
jgi:ribosome-associated protein